MRYVVKTAGAKMPVTCWGKYARVAIIEVDEGAEVPKIIRNTRHARVYRLWDKLHKGGPASAFYRALEEANLLAARLNEEAATLSEGL